MVSKISQSRKDTYCLIPHIWSACCCLVAQLCPTGLQPHGLQPTRLLYLWDVPGKNTRVGCHFLNGGFQGGASGKESACQFKRHRFDAGLGRSLEEEMEPTPVSLPEKFHGKRSLVGYSAWGGKESDITEVTEHASNKWSPFCLYRFPYLAFSYEWNHIIYVFA